MNATPTLTPTPQERAKWQNQPNWFVRQRLGVKPRREQRKLLNALCNNRWVAVDAPKGSGKTYAAALAVIWWLMAYDDHTIALTTAPTSRQVKNQIWREIHKIHRRNKHLIGGNLTQTSLDLGPRRYALGFTTNAAERFQGFRAENILIIADEAAGIHEKIFDAILGCLTSSNAKLLILGNPTKPNGTLHNALKSQKPLWKALQT